MNIYKVLMLVFFSVTLISCGGAEERKAVYLEKAKSSIASGDYEKARIELKNVLQIDPKDSEAVYQLGNVYEKLNNIQKAYGYYLKVEELNPNHLENQAKLGRIYLLFANSPEKAQEKIDHILSIEPNNSEGLLLKAAMLLKNKKKKEAITLVEDIIKNKNGHVEAVLFLSSLYFSDKKIEEAIALLDNALVENADNELIKKRLARILVLNKEYERAELLYKEFVANNPKSRSGYNDLAKFYDIIKNTDKAIETFRKSANAKPDDVERQLTLVKYTIATKGNEDGVNELKNLISKQPGLGRLRTALAELYYITDDIGSAKSTYEQAVKDFPGEETEVISHSALALLAIRNSDFDVAEMHIEEAIKVSSNDPKVNLIRAKLALRNKDLETAIISLRIVTTETPENIEAFILLANTYKLENNSVQMDSTFNAAYENNKLNAEGLLQLAQYHLTRDIKRSEKVIDSFNQIKENSYEGMTIKSVILNQNKKYDEAFVIAEKLIELYPDKPNGYIQTVAYYSGKKDIKKAISTLEKGYINAEDNRKILVLLTTLQVSEKQFNVVEKRLKAELKSSPDDEEFKVLLARVYLANNNSGAAKSLLDGVVSSKSNVAVPYMLLSQIHGMNKDKESMKLVLTQGVENVEKNEKISLRLASIYELDGAYNKAINIYKSINTSFPKNLVAINNLASLLSDHGDGSNDLKLAESLIVKLQQSGQPVFLDTIGWVYYKLGDSDSAILYLKQVVDKAPDINIFNYHLGMAYKLANNKLLAKKYLEKSLADGKEFSQIEVAKQSLNDL